MKTPDFIMESMERVGLKPPESETITHQQAVDNLKRAEVLCEFHKARATIKAMEIVRHLRK